MPGTHDNQLSTKQLRALVRARSCAHPYLQPDVCWECARWLLDLQEVAARHGSAASRMGRWMR